MAAPELVTYDNVTPGKVRAQQLGLNMAEVREAIPELEAACNRKIEAAEDFANTVKLVALKAGLDASVLATYITARVNDTLAKKEKQAEQLGLLFDEIS